MRITEIEISAYNSDSMRCMYLTRYVRYSETLAITFHARKFTFHNYATDAEKNILECDSATRDGRTK